MAKLISGKEVAGQVYDRLIPRVQACKDAGVTPGLAVILVGDDPASKQYVGRKAKMCEKLGFYSEVYTLPGDITQEALLALIEKLAADSKVHGILPQVPLPPQLDEKAVQRAIPSGKDVDAFHPENVGCIMIGDYKFKPCTPAGIMELIASTGLSVSGKECVVVGRSNIVGKPMAMLLLQQSGTVTVAHSRTKDLAAVCRRADILISAVGRAGLITADMVKPGAVVIDVGTNRDSDGKLCGDVDFANVEPVAGYITPVPGGVGPMTIAMLMQNTVIAAEAAAGLQVTK
jgi:methylenetetrahydrofolate dehydrogenase (NADP+)/methenyltetrahydrofolate cyclohydrolase